MCMCTSALVLIQLSPLICSLPVWCFSCLFMASCLKSSLAGSPGSCFFLFQNSAFLDFKSYTFLYSHTYTKLLLLVLVFTGFLRLWLGSVQDFPRGTVLFDSQLQWKKLLLQSISVMVFRFRDLTVPTLSVPILLLWLAISRHWGRC